MSGAVSPQLGAGAPVLVIGATGQLAQSLVARGGSRIVAIGRPEADLDKPETLTAVFDRIKPAAVVNAAAWTAVDLAETETEGAARANHHGPAELARLAALADIPFIHVSTDYVFSGDKGSPYFETDPTSPTGVYGRTKVEGEQAVLAASPKSVILRTAWVYSASGKNFVRTMLNAGAKNPTLRVVGDQRGNPTSSDDLADAILSIIATIERDGWKPAYQGIYHAVGTGETTWHGLAVATLERAVTHGRTLPEVIAIRTEDWPTPAKRPADSRLDTSKLASTFGVTLPHWHDSLASTVDRLLTETPGS